MRVITFAGREYSLNRLYRVSPLCDERALSGRLVWVLSLVEQQGHHWLKVRIPGGEVEWLVQPNFVVPQ